MTTLGSNNYLRDGVIIGSLKAHNVSNIKKEKYLSNTIIYK